jgi:hypothetical protein
VREADFGKVRRIKASIIRGGNLLMTVQVRDADEDCPFHTLLVASISISSGPKIVSTLYKRISTDR